MDIQTITNLITTVGFPIVMCGALFWKINKQDEQHKEEMAKITEALENNTIALTKLTGIVSTVEKEED